MMVRCGWEKTGPLSGLNSSDRCVRAVADRSGATALEVSHELGTLKCTDVQRLQPPVSCSHAVRAALSSFDLNGRAPRSSVQPVNDCTCEVSSNDSCVVTDWLFLHSSGNNSWSDESSGGMVWSVCVSLPPVRVSTPRLERRPASAPGTRERMHTVEVGSPVALRKPESGSD